MPGFSEQFIQQVAQACDIVDLVGNYIALKKRGREFVGLCPFHDDSKPSLNVSPSKQIFKCFACGAGGGVFQFVMMYEKQTFPEAVRILAERAGIPVVSDGPSQTPDAGFGKGDLLKITDFAAQFFRAQLQEPPGKSALDYAHKRGFSDESIERFALGYAPNAWDALLVAAQKKSISPRQLLAAGLVIRKDDGGFYDRFRNRLMFPIIDPIGQVIAFGGRALADDERAKYLNSPESILFDKSRNLYALNMAHKAMKTGQPAVVVEGYLDALIPHQAGIDNVVATLGTALTEGHVRLLSRYTEQVVLVFDADTAGERAAQRAMEIFLAQKIHVRIASIPTGKDPCDYCLAQGPDALRKLIDDAPDALEYLWQQCRKQFQASEGNLANQRLAVEHFLGIVASSQAYGAIDQVRGGQLAQHIGHMLNVSPRDLQQQMRRLSRRIRKPIRRDEPSAEPASTTQMLSQHEKQILEVLLNRPDLFDNAAERIDPPDFTDPNLRVIAECFWAMSQNGDVPVEQFVARQEMAQFGPLLTELITNGEHRENYEQTLNEAVEFIMYKRNRDQIQQLKSANIDDEALRKIGDHHRQADPRRMPGIS